ncbi:MAG: DUF421 domain-containing protein [Thermomicrobiales bacterium]|nr:DUF421 domain-containing protein [Thermomicrobiales bacterium]
MADLLHDLLIPGIPVIEKVVRAVLVYVFLVVIIRVGGKRQLAELTPLDLVIALTLSNAVQNAIIGDDNSVTGGFIGGGVLVLVNYLTVRFLFQHPRANQLVQGEPLVLIEKGRPIVENLKKELITEDELLIACREQGAERIEDVEKAILEPDGKISVFVHEPTPEELAIGTLGDRLDTIEALLRGHAQGGTAHNTEDQALAGAMAGEPGHRGSAAD